MLEHVPATQERSPEHVASRPARRRNCLIDNGFITPDKSAAALIHTHEEILVFTTRSKRGIKWLWNPIQNQAAKKEVSSSACVPFHDSARRMLRPFAKATSDQPGGGSVFEMRPNGSEDSCSA